MDDGQHENPTHDNILAAMEWLSEGASQGDSLFLHYSGHGGYMQDENGGTLCPNEFYRPVWTGITWNARLSSLPLPCFICDYAR